MLLSLFKKLALSAVLAAAGTLSASAAILVITVGGASNTFSPSSATIFLGDTVRWQWAGNFHTSTSTTIPGGAVAWDQPMSSAAGNFDYIPAVTGVYNYLCTPHAPAMAGTFTVSQPLPVKMEPLSAKLTTEGRVQLSWKTLTETNNKQFAIQQSPDGFSFKTIGVQATKAGGGFSKEPISYTYTDKEILATRAFYRLQQTDNDGQQSYSNVCFIARKGAGDLVLHLHPNPTRDQVMIHIAGPVGNEASLQLLDLTGKQLDLIKLTKDNSDMPVFNLSKRAAGVYLIRYTDDSQTLTEKVTRSE
ncbi:T9SS type A sorting domain-containing protein [Taibaiella koreensis]|uniref:T9SS type A sorting domain-containing protein n=1 Tax=Taibaiella koreensis TaxID=1268548 RepID=UPI000E5A05F4|nr:T9SS type A sorting domain-containing protein [Taibaiella koreensis]